MPEGTRLIFPHYLGDIRVNIDTRYKVERIMWTGVYEPELIQYIDHHVRERSICLDIGGNVGAVSLALAKAVGPEGKVYAFEPAPPNYERFRANLNLNLSLAERIHLEHCGCSDQPGQLFWREEPGNPGNGFLGTEGSLAVDVVTLDEFFANRPLPRLDFCKVDVEGMELEVFRGARNLLLQHRPTLSFETLSRFRHAGDRDNFGELCDFLEGLGYTLHRHVSGTEWRPVSDRNLGDTTIAVAERE